MVDYKGLMDECQQLAAYYEAAFERGMVVSSRLEEEDLLKESLDFLADRYDFLIFVSSLPWYG